MDGEYQNQKYRLYTKTPAIGGGGMSKNPSKKIRESSKTSKIRVVGCRARANDTNVEWGGG